MILCIMPTAGIGPTTRVYKTRVIPLNYAGTIKVFIPIMTIDTSWNRTSVSCVKGKSINRYTIAPYDLVKYLTWREDSNHYQELMRLLC